MRPAYQGFRLSWRFGRRTIMALYAGPRIDPFARACKDFGCSQHEMSAPSHADECLRFWRARTASPNYRDDAIVLSGNDKNRMWTSRIARSGQT
jgi:hypothetical protein